MEDADQINLMLLEAGIGQGADSIGCAKYLAENSRDKWSYRLLEHINLADIGRLVGHWQL
jgi:hypothetical protein